MKDKEINYETCGFCTEYDNDNSWCPRRGEMYPEETCEGFNAEVDLLTDEEKKEIIGDRKYHEYAEQGYVIEGEFWEGENV